MSQPVAYFLTWRTFGTWLPGDERGSVDDTHNHLNEHRRVDSVLEDHARLAMKDAPIILTPNQRNVVDEAIRATCAFKGWRVHALNVRTNHVHVILTAHGEPEPVMNTLKSWATRQLREAGLFSAHHSPWGRHGSTIYLWDQYKVAEKIHYVMNLQD